MQKFNVNIFVLFITFLNSYFTLYTYNIFIPDSNYKYILINFCIKICNKIYNIRIYLVQIRLYISKSFAIFVLYIIFLTKIQLYNI